MDPREPAFTAHNAEEEPWRLRRLVRVDGRVRELLRIATPEATDSEVSLGEQVYARHVTALHDSRGTLAVHVTSALGTSAWLAVLALVIARAWDGEDEREVEFLVEGEPLPWPFSAVLPAI